MRILVVTSSFPRFESDTASIFIAHLCRQLAELDITIHVLVPEDKACDNSFSPTSVTVHRFRYFFRRWQKLAYGSGVLANLAANRLLLLQIPSFVVSMLISLIRLSIELKPDIIHAHWIIPQGLVAVLVGRLLGIPVIVTAHGGDAFALQGKVLSWLKSWTLSRCTVWTSNTRATAGAAQRKAKLMEIKQPVIIPMGIDCARFAPAQDRHDHNHFPKSKYTLLFVGRLVEKKGVFSLIEALKRLDPKYRTETILWIIGEGNIRTQLERKTVQLDLKANVRFLGNIENEALPGYFAAADAFIAPSIVAKQGDSEGQGIVYLEAMATGTPIIATTVGGISEVLTDGETALLVPPNQPRAIAEAIARLLNDVSLRKKLITNGLQHVRTNYDWPVIADQFATVYRETQD